jgi:WD40 repeat protein
VKGGAVVRLALSVPPVESVLLKGPSYEITSLAFSPDGKTIAMGTDAQQAILWETSTGWIRWNGDVPVSNSPYDCAVVAFSPDGREVLVGTGGGVALLDAATGKRLRDYYLHSSKDEENEPAEANAVAFKPDGQLIVAALSWQKEPVAVVWDAKTGRRLQTLRGPKPPADEAAHDFYSIAFSRDSRYVIAGPSDAMAVLFDAATGKMLRRFPSSLGSVRSVAISPDGEKLLMGTNRASN